MRNYPDFIENQMHAYPNNDITFAYKKRVLEAMEKRSAQLRKRGLDDENVIFDLVCEENLQIEQGYFDFLEEEKHRKKVKNLPRNIGIYILAMLIAFLGTGFISGVWHPTWLIVEGGVSFLLIYLLLFAAARITESVLYPLARLCVAGSVMIFTQFLFLVIRIPLGVENAYLLFLAAVGLMLLADGTLASLSKQKFAFLSWLFYIPAVSGLLYALLGITHIVAWDPGWLIVVAGIAADVLLVLGTVLYKGRYSIKQELENIWKED